MNEVISYSAIDRRNCWVRELAVLSGDFVSDSSQVEDRLLSEIEKEGAPALIDHLRLCSAIPESYGINSSEEKLYSKYTDAILSASYSHIGPNSTVLTERSDSADVEAVAQDYSFIADAKAFRLSRTAKNQKDFKVQAMDNWKRGKPFAMIVCPLYQLPARNSQIYSQATARNVCIFSYSHLAVLSGFADSNGDAVGLLHEVFKTIQAMNPSKDASVYWQAVNRTMHRYGGIISGLWRDEKIATLESIDIAKDAAMQYYASRREEILKLSHKQAIGQLIKMSKIDSRIEIIKSITGNSIMELS